MGGCTDDGGNRSTVQGYARFSPKNYSKWTKHTVAEHISIGGNGPVLVGTPEQVADGLEAWVEEADVDGFNFVSFPFDSIITVEWLLTLHLCSNRHMLFSLSHSRILSSCFSPNFASAGCSGTTMLRRGGLTGRTFMASRVRSTRLMSMLPPSITGRRVCRLVKLRFRSKWCDGKDALMGSVSLELGFEDTGQVIITGRD